MRLYFRQAAERGQSRLKRQRVFRGRKQFAAGASSLEQRENYIHSETPAFLARTFSAC